MRLGVAPISLALALASGCAGSTRASLPPGFAVVSTASVAPARDTVEITVEGGAQLRGVAVMASGQTLAVRTVRVRYGHRPGEDVIEFVIDADIAPGASTRVLDLPDRYRPVRAVELTLRADRERSRAPARAHLYGLR